MKKILFNLKFLHMTENRFPQALPVTKIRCFKTAQLCNIQMTLRSVKQIYSSPDMTVLNINCSSKSPRIPCYVVGKYDRPHACFPRARLSHQQNLFSIHDVSGIGSPTISNDFSAMRGLDYFKESSNKADSNGIC